MNSKPYEIEELISWTDSLVLKSEILDETLDPFALDLYFINMVLCLLQMTRFLYFKEGELGYCKPFFTIKIIVKFTRKILKVQDTSRDVLHTTNI